MSFNKSAIELNYTVIKGGYCIGCGICAYKADDPFTISLNEYGNYVAEYSEDTSANNDRNYLTICPFSGKSKNEDELNDVFNSKSPNKSRDIGHFHSCYAGYVSKGDFRKKGSSGGMAKWIASELLEKRLVDYVIQVNSNPQDNGDPLFNYDVYSDSNDVINGSKSSYYPNTLIDVVKSINNQDGRYLVTGVPCFIKALKLLSLEDKTIKERLSYTMGIICGGMKSANHAKMIGWQMGVHPSHLKSIDFRRKYKDQPASQKLYQVWSSIDDKERYSDVDKLFGTDYGSGFFRPKPCDFCDDMVAETADISVGDAWIKKYSFDPKGNSLVIVRDSKLNDLVRSAIQKKDINLDVISAEEAYSAQAGGFRHKREALSRRILLKEQSNEWYPKKRVMPGQFELSEKRKKIYDLREKIAIKSHVAFLEALKEDNLKTFYRLMNPLDKSYRKLNGVTQFRLLLRKLKKIFIYKVLKKY